MKRFKIVCFLIFIIPNVLGQSYKGDNVILNITKDLSGSSFYRYSPAFKAKAIYKDTSEVKNSTPEELMISVMSANNYSWEKLNDLKPSERKSNQHYEAVSRMNKDKNYFELHAKFEYEDNGNKIAFVKFYLIKEGSLKPRVGITAMKKISNRWFVIPIPPGMDGLALAVMRFDSIKLETLLEGQPSNDVVMSEFVSEIMNINGGIDFDKLVKEYRLWFGEVRNQKMIDYFIDKNAW